MSALPRTSLVRTSEIIVPEWDPLDADPGLVDAVARAAEEQRELRLLTDPVMAPIMEWALLNADVSFYASGI